MKRVIQRVRISRRSMLKLVAGAAGVIAVSSVGLALFCSRRSREVGTAIRLTWAFSHEEEAAAQVGRTYLALHPEENDEHVIAKLIEATYTLPSYPVGCASTAASALAAQNILDFRAGRVVWLDGWLMARTEARVCALSLLGHRVVSS